MTRHRWRRAVLFACFHFVLQIFLYALGFAVGPAAATREVLGMSLYGVAALVTFPIVTLAERLELSGIGVTALLLNSAVWGGAFRLLEQIWRRHGWTRPGPPAGM